MATIRKRNDKWQVQVRRQGCSPISKSFVNRKDAEVWARQAERAIDQGDLSTLAKPQIDSRTFRELLLIYQSTVTPHKKSAHTEFYRIAKLMRHDIANDRAAAITSEKIASYRDGRLKDVSGETVRQDLVLMRQVLELARREWGLNITRNPVDDVRKPQSSKPRNRRVTFADLRAISKAIRTFANPLFREVIVFALATGMRRGEILGATWSNVDWERRVLFLPVTKNGHARIVPLSSSALRVLRNLADRKKEEELIFPISANAVRLSWQRLKKKANLQDLRFHDTRHEAITRFFEIGLSLPEVALISGHRDPRMLLRYTHMDAAKIAQKLKTD